MQEMFHKVAAERDGMIGDFCMILTVCPVTAI